MREMGVCVCVCVCEREIERERDRESLMGNVGLVKVAQSLSVCVGCVCGGV